MMRRSIKIGLLFLLLGAIVNVAVAWGLAWDFQCIAVSFYDNIGKPPSTPFVVSEELGTQLVILRQVKINEESFDGPSHEFQRPLRRARFGLPCKSLAYDVWWNGGIQVRACILGRTIIGQHHTMIVGAPLMTVWPGFAINTIFYAALLWVVLFAPGRLRRTLRRKRGLCPACGYPIGTSEVCTECGKPVMVKNVEPAS